jgi:hypothetical protein
LSDSLHVLKEVTQTRENARNELARIVAKRRRGLCTGKNHQKNVCPLGCYFIPPSSESHACQMSISGNPQTFRSKLRIQNAGRSIFGVFVDYVNNRRLKSQSVYLRQYYTRNLSRCTSPPRRAMSFSDTRALLVGAGGIGCELLKTLCLHNFKEIFIVRPLSSPRADGRLTLTQSTSPTSTANSSSANNTSRNQRPWYALFVANADAGGQGGEGSCLTV